jgi:hypothetical protein
MKGRVNRTEVQCPLVFAEYNRNMGAIDDFDRLLSFLSVRLRSMKWWHQIFYFIIDAALINALHLWRIDNPEEAATMPRRTWVAGVMEEIIAKYGDRSGCKWVEGIDSRESNSDDDRPAEHTGEGRGGSHQGMASVRQCWLDLSA